jgi:uncharacterized repeat protein (TIGR01451 family)
MKRVLIRLSAVSAVVVAGWIAIVYAQRATHSAEQEKESLAAGLTRAKEKMKYLPPAETLAGQDENPFSKPRPINGARHISAASEDRYAKDPYAQRDTGDRYTDRNVTTAGGNAADEQSAGAVQLSSGPPSSPPTNFNPPPRSQAEPAPLGDLPPFPASAESRTPITVDDSPTTDQVFAGQPTLAKPQPGSFTPGSTKPAMQPPQAVNVGATAPSARYGSPPNPAPLDEAPPVDPRIISQYQATPPSSDAPGYGTPPAEFKPVPSLMPAIDVGAPALLNEGSAEGAGRPGHKQLEGMQSPTLTMEKIAPKEIQVGKPAVFQVKVRNAGRVPAQAVEIRDEVPQGAQLVSTSPQAKRGVQGELIWALGTLDPGEEASVQMELTPTAEGEIGSVATVHFHAAASSRTRVTRPELVLEVLGAKQVMIGEDWVISIKVTNAGSGAATGVVLTERIPENFSHPAGTELEYEVGELKPKQSRELDLNLKAIKPGQVTNVLVATGDGQLQAQHQTRMEVVAPGLEVSMEGPKKRFLERQATYKFTVTNPGTASAREVELVTYLPKGLKFVEANNSGQYDPKTRTVHWLLEELPAKELGSVTLTTMPIEAGEQTVRVQGKAQSGLSAEKEEAILIEGVAALLFQVVDIADPIEVGGETTYEIHVVNQGSKAATRVQVSAIFPPQVKPISAEGPARHMIEGSRVQFQELPRLAPKADTTFRVRAKGMQPGDARVHVQLLSDEMTSPVTKEESTRVFGDE